MRVTTWAVLGSLLINLALALLVAVRMGWGAG